MPNLRTFQEADDEQVLDSSRTRTYYIVYYATFARNEYNKMVRINQLALCCHYFCSSSSRVKSEGGKAKRGIIIIVCGLHCTAIPPSLVRPTSFSGKAK